MRKIIAAILCAILILSCCSCTKIVVDVVFDEQPSREVVVTLPPETMPPETEPPTELTTAPNVNTGEQI